MTDQFPAQGLLHQCLVHPFGKAGLGKRGKRTRECRLARDRAHTRPAAQPAQPRIDLDPVDQVAGCRQVPNRLGNEGARQGQTTLLRPSGATPVRIDEALDRDQVEDLDQMFVRLQEGADFFGELGKKFPLKSVPDIG